MDKRIEYFSVLRVCACVAIVVLHTMFSAAGAFSPNQTQEIISMTIRNSMLWAVPCFVMVTGALLLDPKKEVPAQRIFKKYMPRVLAALVVFTFLFELYDECMGAEGLSWKLIPRSLYKIVSGTGWAHMWYLYLVIAIYLLLPFYRMIAKQATERELKYLLGIYAVFLSVLPVITTATGTRMGFYICVYSVYPLYLFLGYALHNEIIRIPTVVAVLLLVAGSVLLCAITVFSIRNGSDTLRNLSSNYSFPGVVLQSIGIFAVAHNISESRKEKDVLWQSHSRVVRASDNCSFGIYLIHLLILKVLFRILPGDPYSMGGVPLLFALVAVCFLISWLITFLLKRTPGVNRIL